MPLAVLLLVGSCASTISEPALTAPSPTAPSSDDANNRLEALSANSSGELCSADGTWCIVNERFLGEPAVIQRRSDWIAARLYPIDTPDEGTYRPWPFIVRIAQPGADDPVLVGLLAERNDSYTGGGASDVFLTLYRLSNGRAISVLEVQQGGAASIRSCFDDDDRRARLDACLDEYRFVGALALDASVAGGRPRFIYVAEAATYPGRVSRNADSLARGRLRRQDLTWTRDETCSYRRTYAWDEAASMYAPDEPLPACEDYGTQ